MITHRNLGNLCRGLELGPYQGHPGCRRVGLNASISFDSSVKQIVQVLAGRTLYPIPQETRLDPATLLNFISDVGLECIDCTPSQLNALVGLGLLDTSCRALKMVLVGGEAIEPTLWRKLANSSDISFYNVYGPTECTVDTTSAFIGMSGDTPVIGRTLLNTRVHLLNMDCCLIPNGDVGEIYIGGEGVGRGYLNRPELTAERYVANPFGIVPGGRLYKSGDLARSSSDGTLEYIGRNDAQVKIRGFRVELGEIEAQLRGHSEVLEAAVVIRQLRSGENGLVAYVILDTPSRRGNMPPIQRESSSDTVDEGVVRQTVRKLREALKGSLPGHMVPTAIVSVQQMPLTANGKLDRRALSAADWEGTAGEDYEAPVGKVEAVLSDIWQDLLKVEAVGRQDNFFELGGHSLLVAEMNERLREAGIAAEALSVFEKATLAELASALTADVRGRGDVPPNLIPDGCVDIEPEMLPLVELSREEIARIARTVPGGSPNIQDIYPLAPLQEGILFHHLLGDEQGDTYVLPTLLSVPTREALDGLISGLQAAVDRHEMLRSAVLWEDLPRPVHVVHRRVTMPMVTLKLNPAEDPIEQLRELMKPRHQKLSLNQAPLLRLQIAEDAPTGKWYALLQLHHLVCDHTALGLLISEVLSHIEGRSYELPPALAYRNHVARSLERDATEKATHFFREKLGDVHASTAPFELVDVHGDGSRIVNARMELDPDLARRLRSLARRNGTSMATLFHSAWALVVAHTSGRNDVVFGTVLLGRLHAHGDALRTVGMFINTLPLRLKLQDVGVIEFVKTTQRELGELFNHEDASLAEAQRCSGISDSEPLFTSLLNYVQNPPNFEANWARAASGVRVIASEQWTNYPITLSVEEWNEGFALIAQTDRQISPQRLVAYMDTALRSLVGAEESGENTPALSLSILPELEYREVVQGFNDTASAYPREKLVHELLEEQVKRTPGAIAAEYEGETLTYKDLDDRANRLAESLRGRGVEADKLVGICVERSLEMVVGLFGILKAGGAYVPLDPNYPAGRLEYMLKDANPNVLLTQKRLMARLPETTAKVVALDECETNIGERVDISRERRSSLHANNLVYVIYTSGSTGQPKGTAMAHRSMVNLIEWHRRDFAAAEGRRVLQFAALSFDVAFQEIFSTLCTGGCLVLLNEWIRRDARALTGFLCNNHIERIFMPPLMLQSLAEYAQTTNEIPVGLRDIITAGEQLRLTPEARSFFARLDGCRLHNHYGPTETHVVTALTLSGQPDRWPMLPPIGRPISNIQIYVLNEKMQPAPKGIPGEIYIAGVGLARGYLNRRELTDQRFVDNPFDADPGARLYKTGDQGRWLPDGTLEYLGRNDFQIKVRGYRIELGEIEAKLAEHDLVKETVVAAQEDCPNEKRLVAYVVARNAEEDLDLESLRAHLRASLPDHMIPGAFVRLERLPLTPNGKLDRRALPSPEPSAYSIHPYEPPQGRVEEVLVELWKEVLHVEQIGRRESFFDLGGHSLSVLKVVVKANQLLQCNLRVSDLYRSPTLRDLASAIDSGKLNDRRVDLAQEVSGDVIGIPVPEKPGLDSGAILLTGATGFVGRFLLSQLVRDTSARIYCLIRSRSEANALGRLRATLSRWDLWDEELASRIIAVPGDMAIPGFGLSELKYLELSKKVTIIHHCATSMNHLETYEMAKPANVLGSRQLLTFASRERPKVINYISTLGVFKHDESDPPRLVTESSPIDYETHWHSRGYEASKWVGEKLFMLGNERGIACNVFRLGLVWADSRQGRYDELQHHYRLLKSCLLSGMGISGYRYTLPPTPVDYMTRATVYLASRYPHGGGIFHLSASHQNVNGVFEYLNDLRGTELKLLPFSEWIQGIRKLDREGRWLPIIPLMEFYEQRGDSADSLQFDCRRTQRELEEGGIGSPIFDGKLLATCIDGMLSRDPDLSRVFSHRTPSRVVRRDDNFAKRDSNLGDPPAERAAGL